MVSNSVLPQYAMTVLTRQHYSPGYTADSDARLTNTTNKAIVSIVVLYSALVWCPGARTLWAPLLYRTGTPTSPLLILTTVIAPRLYWIPHTDQRHTQLRVKQTTFPRSKHSVWRYPAASIMWRWYLWRHSQHQCSQYVYLRVIWGEFWSLINFILFTKQPGLCLSCPLPYGLATCH